MPRKIDSRVLFLTTSPRTPGKMVPEIGLLASHFAGRSWNKETQRAFMERLREEHFFAGKGENDPALSARDRINRAPKSLGFVVLSPCIALTPAGQALLTSKRTEEVFLRQLLKFQVPSPYHTPTAKAATFCVKPYLELLRLVRTMGILRFDELQLFGMQLTDWHDFDCIVRKIERFRKEKAEHKGSYRQLKVGWLRDELTRIYRERIAQGATRTRESADTSLEKFLKTQSSNMRDYADAGFRYLRATGLVNVSHVGKSLSIVAERVDEVDYILATVDRNPCFVNDEASYIAYLGNADLPRLLTDDRQRLVAKIHAEFPHAHVAAGFDVAALKDLLANLREQQRTSLLHQQVAAIKDYRQYDDIQHVFKQIADGDLYDAPLMLEWNSWRAMTMLDGGDVIANLNFDDYGKPLSTALANKADIVCDYGDYLLTVEVTMSSGHRQFEAESESVSRHLGNLKKSSGKPCYCLFIAPTINESCIAFFYALHNMNVAYYGGKSVIVPIPLNVFQKMLEDSYKASYVPNPDHVRRFFEHSAELANSCKDEIDWYSQVTAAALDWLS